MVEKMLTPKRNVVDFAKYQQGRKAIAALRGPLCRHCGAILGEHESEDECSGAGLDLDTPRFREGLRKFYAE
jgi:hypothetical protein